MARITGVDLPNNKRLVIALTYIKGIGPTMAKSILDKVGLVENMLVKDLSENEIVTLRSEIGTCVTEGDLKRKVQQDIRRLQDIGCYRGYRHKRKLPCRGQRTHTNARTKRGKKIAIAGKKKVTK